MCWKMLQSSNKERVVVMKIKVDGDDNELHLQVNGDIYKEHAECLCDMAFGHAQRGVKKVDIQICKSCYINSKGHKYLCEMKTFLEKQGVEVTVQKN